MSKASVSAETRALKKTAIEHMLKMHDDGLDLCQIGELLGVHPDSVRRTLRRLGQSASGRGAGTFEFWKEQLMKQGSPQPSQKAAVPCLSTTQH